MRKLSFKTVFTKLPLQPEFTSEFSVIKKISHIYCIYMIVINGEKNGEGGTKLQKEQSPVKAGRRWAQGLTKRHTFGHMV